MFLHFTICLPLLYELPGLGFPARGSEGGVGTSGVMASGVVMCVADALSGYVRSWQYRFQDQHINIYIYTNICRFEENSSKRRMLTERTLKKKG